MGGCASKPKVLRDEIDAPIPRPLPLPQLPAPEKLYRGKQEEVTKDVVVVEEAPAATAVVNGESQFELVDDVNDIPSVIDLSSQDEKQSSEEVKEEIFETKEASEPSESKPQQDENPTEEQAQDLIVVDVTAEPEPESEPEPEPEVTQEAASMAEAPEPETWVEKTIEEVKEVTEVTRIDDDKDPERETGEHLEEDVPEPEIEAEEEGLIFALDHTPEPENLSGEELDIAEDNATKTTKTQAPLEEKIEEKQIITADEKPQEMKTEEVEVPEKPEEMKTEEVEEVPETTATTKEGTKKAKKQYWPIASLLRNPLGNFAKAK